MYPTIGPFVTATPITAPVNPVTVADFKQFHEIDFNDHDAYIELAVNGALYAAERYTGCSLVPKTVTVRFESLSGEAVELPRGPITSDPAITIGTEAAAADSYKVSAGDFRLLEMASSVPVEITYQVGYTTDTFPEPLKTAILWKAWEHFMQKTGKVKTNWKAYASEFRRPYLCL